MNLADKGKTEVRIDGCRNACEKDTGTQGLENAGIQEYKYIGM
jgi:hypothetical protein